MGRAEDAGAWLESALPQAAEFVGHVFDVMVAIRRERARYQLAERVALTFVEQTIMDADEESFTPDVIARHCAIAAMYARRLFPDPSDPPWPADADPPAPAPAPGLAVPASPTVEREP